MIFSYFLILNQAYASMAAVPRRGIGTEAGEWNRGASFRAWKGQNIIDAKMQGYDPHRRPYPIVYPNGTIAPVIVTTSIALKSIGTVKEQNMEFKAQFRFQQEWFDERLRFDSQSFREFDFIHLAADPKQRIWIPDTFFQNEKEGKVHLVDQENYFIKVRADGKVIYNRRLSMTFSCVMNLLKYPMDNQTCVMDFASYAYTTADIIYEWDTEPLVFKPGATSALPNFFLTEQFNASCTSVTLTGTYSCLRVVIRLQRVFSFFLLQLYIPSSMLVAVSWVSYWIDWRATAGRVPLAIVTLLTMITQSHVINQNLPPVSYTKAIDVWIGACVMFIFGSLVEYAFVNYTGIREQQRRSSVTSTPVKGGNGRKVESIWDIWDMFMGRDKKRRISDHIHHSDGVIRVQDVVQERAALLRNRSSRISRRLHYHNAIDTMDESFDSLATIQRRQAVATVTTAPQPFLSETPVHFEDISANLDWIRLRTRRKVELLQWCRIFKQRSRAERIDFVSRMLFPMAFFLFNIVYWVVYWM